MFSLISKIKKKNQKKELNKNITKEIEKISKKINSKKIINFLHSGHLGDLINSLPVIKEIAKKRKCNLYININKKIELNYINNIHPAKEFYLSPGSYKKIFPLIRVQPYISKLDVFNNQSIDVNLDLFRKLPINFNIDSVRWYSHLTGINPELNKPYILNVKRHSKFKNNIVFMRSLRRQNKNIKFNFFNKYNNLLFIGLYDEYIDLKKQIKKLKYYDCKNFLEMSEIIKASRLFIGNLSFGFTIAEGLKIPRLVESYLDFPLVYPNGTKGYEFYFQNHFENFVRGELKK